MVVGAQTLRVGTRARSGLDYVAAGVKNGRRVDYMRSKTGNVIIIFLACPSARVYSITVKIHCNNT
jgi:hypothetical protein